jgi:ATP-dependent Clp protease adaptor protein ClpS
MVAPTTQSPSLQTLEQEKLEDMYQVILHNDDHNTAEHVVQCLMRVFGHNEQLATKIMLEAHTTGKAVAEVEGETEARLHRDQLQSFGLTATVEKV